jgi:mono/diheme cytochrome c family protein
MISAPMKVVLTTAAAMAAALAVAACGGQNVNVATQNPLHAGAVLFNQRCSGCHTLSYAAARGSAANVRSAQYNNGPNFNIRCERPVDRVLYAIENGGFSGQIMPQNIVVGQQAREVAQFVATYSGRQAPQVTGTIKCQQQPIGTLIAANQTTPSSTPTPTSTTATQPAPTKPAHPTAKKKAAAAKPKK